MNIGFRAPSIPFRSIHHLIQSVLPQLNFSFYRHQPIRADFSGGQIPSAAGLLPLRAFDQRHHLTRDWAAGLSDPRQHDRLRHDSLALLRQRIYQIVAGYEDANDADRLRHDPMLQIVADQKLGDALGSQPTLSRWENAPSARDLVHTNDLLCQQFIRCVWRPGPPAWRDSARHRLHRRSHSWPATTQLLQRWLWPAHVSPHADLRASHRMSAGRTLATGKCLQSCSHRAHAAALGTAFAVCFPRRKDQTARRCRFCSAPALPVLRVLRYRVCPRHPRQLRLQASRPTTAEAVATALSPHPITPAQLFQLPPSRPPLAAPAPHLLQDRTYCRRNQPALPDHQLRRTCLPGLRFLHRSRGVRESHRGVQKRFSRRSLKLSPLPGQLLPPVPARRRLQPGQLLSSAVAAPLAFGPDRNLARKALQNRRSRSSHCPLCSLSPRHRLAVSELVPRCRLRRQQRLTRPFAPNPAFHRLSLPSRAQNYPSTSRKPAVDPS